MEALRPERESMGTIENCGIDWVTDSYVVTAIQEVHAGVKLRIETSRMDKMPKLRRYYLPIRKSRRREK